MKQLLLLVFSMAIASSAYCQEYSGYVKTYSGVQEMQNKRDELTFDIQPEQKSKTDVFFVYYNNFENVKKGKYKIQVIKIEVNGRRKEMVYDFDLKSDLPAFYNRLSLEKGCYSIRVYKEDNTLLGYSSYFTVKMYPGATNGIANN